SRVVPHFDGPDLRQAPRYTRAHDDALVAPRPARPRAGALAARTPERTVTGGDGGERPGSPVGPRLRSRRYALRHRAPGVDPCRQERPARSQGRPAPPRAAPRR